MRTGHYWTDSVHLKSGSIELFDFNPITETKSTSLALPFLCRRQILSEKVENPNRNKKMGKQPVRMKAVIYALSPFQQKVMTGLWKDLPTKIHHKVSENWISATLLLAPLVGTYT